MKSRTRTWAAWRVAFMFGLGLVTRPTSAQNSPELASLDMWIVQRYRGAQLLPDTTGRAASRVTQVGAPRVESARSSDRRDTVVALHFSTSAWRPALASAAAVQMADPSGAVSAIAGRVTARRAFRAPRKAGARDSVNGDWRIGWAYLVAIPLRTASAASAGLSGWALVETAKVVPPKPEPPVVVVPPELPTAIPPRSH
ncbi:MAG: hypothetical protein H7Z40_19985 [Phycisphaerae bacterium]|nr:hypothetical protein [Gemmatimonadaceae bacterium]